MRDEDIAKWERETYVTDAKTIDMRQLTDAIRALGVPATYYQSGGGVGTIGVGNLSPSPHYPDYADFPYNVGPSSYFDGEGHRDELGSGPQDWGYDPAAHCWTTDITADESIGAYAQRVVTTFRAYRDAYPERVGSDATCDICGELINAWEESPDGGRWCGTCNTSGESVCGICGNQTSDGEHVTNGTYPEFTCATCVKAEKRHAERRAAETADRLPSGMTRVSGSPGGDGIYRITY